MQGVGEDGLLFKRKHALQGWNAAHACRLGGSASLPTEILKWRRKDMSHRNHSAPTLGCDFILIRHPTAYIRHHKETRMGSLRLHLICLMGANDFVDLSGEGGNDVFGDIPHDIVVNSHIVVY